MPLERRRRTTFHRRVVWRRRLRTVSQTTQTSPLHEASVLAESIGAPSGAAVAEPSSQSVSSPVAGTSNSISSSHPQADPGQASTQEHDLTPRLPSSQDSGFSQTPGSPLSGVSVAAHESVTSSPLTSTEDSSRSVSSQGSAASSRNSLSESSALVTLPHASQYIPTYDPDNNPSSPGYEPYQGLLVSRDSPGYDPPSPQPFLPADYDDQDMEEPYDLSYDDWFDDNIGAYDDNSSESESEVEYFDEITIDNPGIAFDASDPAPASIPTYSKPLLLGKIDTKISVDKETPRIYDLIVISVGITSSLVVADIDNCALKSFSNHCGLAENDWLQLKGPPMNLTAMSENKGAVAVPKANQIVVFSVNRDLAVENIIMTNKKYCGLARLTSTTFAAGEGFPGSIDILDMSGTVLKTICSRLFAFPKYLAPVSENCFLVSDHGKQSVTCVTESGEVKFAYRPSRSIELKFVRGVTVSGSGDVFVVDCNRDKVIQLNLKGDCVRDIVTSQDQLKNPWAVHVDDHNSMFVSCGGRYVSVYKFVLD